MRAQTLTVNDSTFQGKCKGFFAKKPRDFEGIGKFFTKMDAVWQYVYTPPYSMKDNPGRMAKVVGRCIFQDRIRNFCKLVDASTSL